ncbi:MAG: dUTP diphosphatase [bacterium]|nr:dUTP diphosphatase [bacterium]
MITEKQIKIHKINENARVPAYATPSSAGADLYALCDEPVVINPGQTKLIHTGIALEIPEGFAGFIYARSGLATKHGIAPANKVGVIDADYRGEIMVSLYNQSSQQYTITDGERIAQMVVAPYLKADFCVCDTLENTQRGVGGFGSTGRK